MDLASKTQFILSDIYGQIYEALKKECSHRVPISKSEFIHCFLTLQNVESLSSTILGQALEQKPSLRRLIYDVLDRNLITTVPHMDAVRTKLENLNTILRSIEPADALIGQNTDDFLSIDDYLTPSISITGTGSTLDSDIPREETDIHMKFECEPLEEITDEDNTHVLRLVHGLTKKTNKPKRIMREFFRVLHIRGMKKSIRELNKRKVPIKSIHRLKYMSGEHEARWGRLRKFFEEHRDELLAISDTTSSPLTDGKSKRKTSSSTATSRTFNQAYCRSLFNQAYVMEYYNLYCDLVYYGTPEDMCEKMTFYCCGVKGETHTQACENVWKKVHQYAIEGTFQELNLIPKGLGEVFKP